MNYYNRHIGDYAKDTGHLSMIEDGAYTRMMDVYYGREQPLPLDRDKLYRLVRVRGAAERKAVDDVLAEFFQMSDGGWHHKRCDGEIARANAKSEKARQSADARWNANGYANVMRTHMPTHSEGNAPSTPIASTPIELQVPVGSAPKNGARHVHLDDSPVVISLPLRDGSKYEVRSSLVTELEPLYPNVDISRTLGEMKGWLLTNPDRLKTRRGAMKFIGGWLQREEEKHGG